LLALDPLADPEHVAVGVTHVHLSDSPRLIGRRVGHLEALLQAVLVEAPTVSLHRPQRFTSRGEPVVVPPRRCEVSLTSRENHT
jgi:hypothetical protein